MEFNPVPLEEFLKEDEEDGTPWLVKNMIKRGGYTLVSGPPKRARKSFLMERIGLLISGGMLEARIEPQAQGRVLYVSEEGPKIDAQDRLRAQCTSLGLEPGMLGDRFCMLHMSGFRLFLEPHADAITRWCENNSPLLVILDPWAELGPPNENESEPVKRCMWTVKELQRMGVSVAIITHLKKEGPVELDIDEEVRGSSVLLGAYDSHLALRPMKGGKDTDPVPLKIRQKNGAYHEYGVLWKFTSVHDAARDADVLTRLDLEWSERKSNAK